MLKYNEKTLFSFKCDESIEKDILIEWEHITKSKKIVTDKFWAETTDNERFIRVPDMIFTDLRNNSPHGYTGAVKDGTFKIGGRHVALTNGHCIYNGFGYVEIVGAGENDR